MAAAVGVLCARVRVEEKRLIAALAEAGLPALPLAPATLPLPVGPIPPPSPLPPVPAPGSDAGVWGMRLVLDRCQDRVVAAATLPLWRAGGARTLDSGLAATGSRLDVAAAFAAAGLPRPLTRLACSPEAALAALDEIGEPATLLPLTPGAARVSLPDRDTAEAVVEHRTFLGAASEAVALIQDGVYGAGDTLGVVVVAGRAVATTGDRDTGGGEASRAFALAERAADALGAAVVEVVLAFGTAGPLVWDVLPVPEFRHAVPIGTESVAGALAGLAAGRPLALGGHSREPGSDPDRLIRLAAGPEDERVAMPIAAADHEREVAGGIALSA